MSTFLPNFQKKLLGFQLVGGRQRVIANLWIAKNVISLWYAFAAMRHLLPVPEVIAAMLRQTNCLLTTKPRKQVTFMRLILPMKFANATKPVAIAREGAGDP